MTAADIERERAAFEAWFPSQYRYLLAREASAHRDYEFQATQLAWDAWLEATRRASTRTGISPA